jgi:phage major head subunit gpT-like protein
MTEGGAVSYDTSQQGFINRANAVKYGLGFVITKDMYDDNQYNLPMIKGAKALARSVVTAQETVVANMFVRAFNSTYTFGDGKEMCATDHPNVAGGTYANELSTAADFSETSLEQAMIDLAKLTDDRGNRINISAHTILVPPDIQFEVRRLLESQGRLGTANNDTNLHNGSLKMVVNPYLTDTDAWFLRTSMSEDGPVCVQRQAATFSMDNDFDTDNAKFKVVARFATTCPDPKGIFGSPGA